MTPEELDAIKAREAEATPGPWIPLLDPLTGMMRDDIRWEEIQGKTNSEVHRADRLGSPDGCIIGCWYDYSLTSGGLMTRRVEDAEFIAHARTDIPKLLAELGRLQRIERIERLVFAWQRAYTAYYQAKDPVSVEAALSPSLTLPEYRRAAEALHDAEAALYAELVERQDDGHGRKESI